MEIRTVRNYYLSDVVIAKSRVFRVDRDSKLVELRPAGIAGKASHQLSDSSKAAMLNVRC